MMRYVLAFLVAFIVSTNIEAAVWQDGQVWSVDFEKKYGEWMKSEAVHKDLFVSKESKYYGIIADCADASYALRAIFSLENNLPFKVLNPSATSAISPRICSRFFP